MHIRVLSSALLEIMVVDYSTRKRESDLGYYYCVFFFHFCFKLVVSRTEKQRKRTNEPFRLRTFSESERFIVEHWDCFKSHKLSLAGRNRITMFYAFRWEVERGKVFIKKNSLPWPMV